MAEHCPLVDWGSARVVLGQGCVDVNRHWADFEQVWAELGPVSTTLKTGLDQHWAHFHHLWAEFCAEFSRCRTKFRLVRLSVDRYQSRATSANFGQVSDFDQILTDQIRAGLGAGTLLRMV